MRRILLIWELGGEYGHITRLLPIALAFRQRGFEPVLMLRDLSRAENLLGSHRLCWLQSPVWVTEVAGLPAAISYAETLMRFGYLDVPGLTGVCRAWRELFRLLDPAMILCDHAPTAMLASRGMGIPSVVLGDGFVVPPEQTPMPGYQWWSPPPYRRLADSEAKVLATVNSVLMQLHQPTLSHLHELLHGNARMLCTSKPLDGYPDREPNAEYLGVIASLDQGVAPHWPVMAFEKRIFAYLKPRDVRFEATLQALNQLEANTLVHAPGVSGKLIDNHTTPRLAFSREPLRMADIASEADLIVCHGGRMADIALSFGKPALLLPMQTEQLMTSKRAEQLGTSLLVTPEQPPTHIKKSLKRLLQESVFSERARHFAEPAPLQEQSNRVDKLVDRCIKLLP